ncbi:MAG TPA: plastocyanin/azurin family copper-binding protein [Gemmatimonadaceae bacterium]|nr:plastocyanin/azurin family copper-binding protein [Gemmatimonadaceae bacterium]
MRFFVLVLTLAAGVTVAASCGDFPLNNFGQGISSGGGTGGGSDTSTTASVNVGDNFFNPSSVTVAGSQAQNGAQVTWTWTGTNTHQIVWDDGYQGSAPISVGSYQRTFQTAGTYTYYCAIHGRAVMSGSVQVQ